MRIQRLLALLSTLALLIIAATPAAAQCAKANRTTIADVVAFDQTIMLNRRGASIPEGMMFALRSDVVAANSSTPIGPGNVTLRPGKRPRPIVLRVNQYDCLQINFTNWLAPTAVNNGGTGANTLQTATRTASIHVNGMQLSQISDDGSYVGQNTPSSLVTYGGHTTYNLYATEEGTFLLYSLGAAWGGSNTTNGGAQQSEGLFGAVHVEPPDAEWYRSQVTRAELDAASSAGPGGSRTINYDKLRMYTSGTGDKTRTITNTDLTAVITGANHGRFNPNLYPCNDPNGPNSGCGAKTNPNFALNYAEPDRVQPYREFTIVYHELFEVTQALPEYYVGISTQTSTANTNLTTNTLPPIQDQFAINYGTGGIGSEILANRLGIGPEGGCPDCKYEEFFLDSWTVGDPSMVVAGDPNDPNTGPANAPCTPWVLYSMANQGSETCTVKTGAIDPATGIMVPVRKAKYALYPDDPSNVYHSYLNDHVKFRILHGGTGFSHVHHQHAHQWLRTPNNNESTYLDSQLINPGSAYTLEITFGGSGNRNHTPGDSIFHCHFYPHFAGGMWALWRVHDTFEPGTLMNGNVPAAGYARALPDAEILAGTPTPAIVPLPTIAEAPMPADVQLVQVTNPGPPNNVIGTKVEVKAGDNRNPGYPFFVPGISGVRAPHPPLDFAVGDDGKPLDGGLPRHLLLTGSIAYQQETPYDFSKDLGNINAFQLPEDGTPVEKVAMGFHAQCYHSSFTPDGSSTLPDGKPALFFTNGLPPAHGAPYADPALLPFNPNNPPQNPNDRCKPVLAKDRRLYKAAVFQTDLVFNKQGWHYPQARMLSLWQDVGPTLNGDRPPQPLFFRVESDDATEYWHTNLVPDYYQLDDFQVRTPTDIIGQHIHLVKFDVLASDGASNGWNYEDGTFSPDEVRARIKSINACKGLLTSLTGAAACGSGTRTALLKPTAPPTGICTSDCQPEWMGAQTTVQRWMADPLKSPAEDPKIDRTLRTVFTHDHFGPSTHQQTGLYAAFVIEPPDTQWFENETGTKMYTRPDGGPTSWQAVVEPMPGKPFTDANTFREFALALQDFQLTYAATSIQKPSPARLSDHLNCQPPYSPAANPSTAQCGWADPSTTGVLNMSQSGAPYSYANMSQQGVSAGPTQGTYTFNYRNEPLPYRLQKPATGTPPPNASDPSYVFASTVTNRVNPTANPQPAPGGSINCAPLATCTGASTFKFPKNPLTLDMRSGDPYTPMLRAYEKDNVQVRVIVGAHMLPHPFTMQGVKWLFEAGDALTVASAAINAAASAKAPDLEEVTLAAASPLQDNSGFRSTQAMGISEHFEFLFHVPPSQPQKNGFTDFLYMPDSSNPPYISGSGGGRGIVDGMWGIMRAYQSQQPQNKPLMPLPNNVPPATPPPASSSDKPLWWAGVCGAYNTKTFTVYAQNATINYNNRPLGAQKFSINNELVYSTNPNVGTANEPLILHANAGDCLQVTLQNNFTTSAKMFTTQHSGYASNSAFNDVANAKGNDPQKIYAINPSQRAGLNAALVAYDVATGSGTNIGFNAGDATVSTAAGSNTKTYYWYAGHIARGGHAIPVEFGAVNLTPSDPIQQDTYGLVGGLIVEPPNSVFCPDSSTSNAMGTVYQGTSCTQKGAALFREFVLVTQDNLSRIPTTTNGGNTLQVALNYRMENLYGRFDNPDSTNTIDLSPAFSNALLSCTATGSPSPCTPQCTPSTVGSCDPLTPIFTASAGMPIRMHLLHPGGASDQQVFAIHGHIWQDEPYQKASTVLGWNPDSPWIGSRDIYGANSAYSILIPSAGGANKVPGDYLYRTHPANFLAQGMWGIIRVKNP
jgi:hypothetical protein